MENKKLEITVTCKDESTVKKYSELAQKMANDTALVENAKKCANMKELYELYKKNGYTDLSFEDFAETFKRDFSNLGFMNPNEMRELSDDDLENIAGGGWFSVICATVSFIPIAGPLISGVAKAVKAGIEGKGIGEIVKHTALGVTGALFDTVVTIGTAGVGTGATIAIKAGIGALKSGTSVAVDYMS